MRKISDKERELEAHYQSEVRRKFGSYPASTWDYCCVCGKTYGEHCGYECPEEEIGEMQRGDNQD